MPETFLILVAGGCMLAAAVPNPREVTLQWLRLAGLIALTGCGLAVFFYFRREPTGATPIFLNVQRGLIAATIFAILGQLAFVQVAWRLTQRWFSFAAYLFAVLAGCNLIHDISMLHGTKAWTIAWQTIGVAGIAAMAGLTLMDMLLGHAYLTAGKMTIAPFRRLNGVASIVLIERAISSVVITMAIQQMRPIEMLWGIQGLYIGTRWFVGLLVPAVFFYMAHDCIKRRSTQSATGILYVAGVLIFIGEIVALHLVQQTGLPF